MKRRNNPSLHRIQQSLLLFFIVLGMLSFVNQALSKVDPPNYNFSLEELSVFYPGSSFAEIEKKHGKGELVEDSGEIKNYKFYVAQIRYKFPVFVQVYKDQVLDFYTRLPSYFLHDVFHQSLINRYGKQESYYKKENHAVYIWKNENGIQFVYQAGCTITCFPMYLSGVVTPVPQGAGGFSPLIKKINNLN